MKIVAQALWFSLPVILAGLTHIAAIRLDWLPALARVPLDGGCTVRGRRLLGANKTLRGALVMVAATVLATAALAWAGGAVHRELSVADLQRNQAWLWGLLLGLGYVVGELPNSFIKRQLDIPPGAAPRHRWRALFWTLDQADSLIGILVVLAFVWRPDPAFAAVLLALTLLVHPAVAGLMVMLNLKDRIG